MKLGTIWLPDVFSEEINSLFRENDAIDRPNAIRTAVRELILHEILLDKDKQIRYLSEKMDSFQEIFTEILASHSYSLELKEYYLELRLRQDLGLWIFRYDNCSSSVYLLHTECLSCQNKCQRIREEKIEKICLIKTSSIPHNTSIFSKNDLEFIAKVFFILETQFPHNEQNLPKKLPFCRRLGK